MKWDTVRLGDIALQKGGSIDPRKFSEEVFELYSIPAFDVGTPEVIAGSKIGSSKKMVQANDVMISRIVPHIRRAWVVAHFSGYRQIASGEWIVFRDEKIWPQYLRWLLVNDVFHSAFMRTVSGVGGSLLRARPAEVYKIEIPLPPLPEQQRIAAILDAADELRSKRRESIKLLDDLIQSTFLEMFGDPRLIDKTINRVKLSEIASIKMGQSPPGSTYNKLGEGIPLLNGPSEFGIRFPKEVQWTTAPTRLCMPGDIIFCVRGATAGRINEADKVYCLGRGVAAISGIHDGTNAYITAVLRSLYDYFQLRGVGSTFINISRKDLETLQIPNPPIELQHQFVSIIESIEKQKARLQAHLEELDTLFAALQQRAFNGDL